MRRGNESGMAEQIHLGIGAHPWVPSSAAEPIATLNYWNVPTWGVFRQVGALYEYRCFAGAVDEWSAWMYREIPSEVLPDLLRGDERYAWLGEDSLPVCAVALAHESRGIVDSHYLDNPDLLNSALGTLMAYPDLPYEVEQQLRDEIAAAA